MSEEQQISELRNKIDTLVNRKFHGDYKKAFDYYDKRKDLHQHLLARGNTMVLRKLTNRYNRRENE